MVEKLPLHERYRQLSIRIGKAHSAVAVTAQALENSNSLEEHGGAGGTDLELHSADVLEDAAELLQDLSNIASMMWHEVRDLEEAGEESTA